MLFVNAVARLARPGVCVLGLVVVLCGTAVFAEGPKPFPDFSAKRVKPPQPGQTKRITVQIEANDPSLAAGTDSADTNVAQRGETDGAGAGGGAEWFWQEIAPELSASAPGRLEPALRHLAQAPEGHGVRSPRLDTLRAIVSAHGTDILLATIGKQVSPALVLAVIAVESGGEAQAVSHAGAQGLMQLMPDTAARFDVADAFEATSNIAGGVAFLDLLMTRFASDPILVLAGYNAGEGAIATHAGVPPFAETRAYVPKVLAAFQVARALCQTPPELITDGCVFAQP